MENGWLILILFMICLKLHYWDFQLFLFVGCTSGFWEVRDLTEITAICNHLQGHCRLCKISTIAIVKYYISIGSQAIYLRTKPSGERTVLRSSFFLLKYTFDWQMEVYRRVTWNCLKFNGRYEVKREDGIFAFFSFLKTYGPNIHTY